MYFVSKNRVNTTRQPEMDFARGLAVLFMVLIHVQEYFFNGDALNTSFAGIVDFLGGIPAAPVFMFLMGVGIVYSKKSDPKTLFKRGIKIMVLGYFLNFMRGVLPNLFHAFFLSDSSFLREAAVEFSYVDIFQFSGLALMTFALLSKFKARPLSIILLMSVLMSANALIASYSVHGLFLGGISGLIWGSNEYSFFPYLTWMIYPLAGYLFGLALIHVNNKLIFYFVTGFTATLIMVGAYYLFNTHLGWDIMLNDAAGYYKHGFAGQVIALAFVISWISILHFASFVLHKKIKATLSRWSKLVTEIYVIHWLYIGWLAALMGYSTLILPYGLLLTLIIFVTSDAIASFMNLSGKKFMSK
ncbi:MAG: hypothetical protein JXR88_09665 [Clostridia bacterium]|nr:hypothetical protein [Clostridia bacterium]